MGTAAVTGAPAERDAAPREEPLSPKPRVAGSLLAVCSLCGGAGASTLSYLVATHVARSSERPVLVCDTGGPTGGLAAYGRVESPRSLPRTADAIAAHEPLAGGLFADAEPGLRVIAGAPEPAVDGDEGGTARLLEDARAAHALTVVDCGTPGGATERHMLATATHVAWVLPATVSGLRRGERVLELFGVEASRREIVVARYDASGRKAPTDDLRRLAGARSAPLVLMPHVPDLGEQRPDEALEVAAVTLDAIAAVLAR